MNRSDLQALRSFESEVRQLLAAYKQQQEELQRLRVLLGSKDEEIGKLQSSLRSFERAYSNLKIARMLEVSDGDIRTTKLRITRLVREVNKCIRLLSAEMGDIDSPESASSKKEQETVLPPSDGEPAAVVSDTETEIEINPSPEASEEVAFETAKETSDIDSVSDNSLEISTNDSETPEIYTDSTKDKPESPDVDAEPSKDEPETAEPAEETSEEMTKTADDAAESLKDEQQPSDEETVPSKVKTSPPKESESSETPKTDSKSKSLLLEIESEPEPAEKKRDLWTDFGMLPLFSDDDAKR